MRPVGTPKELEQHRFRATALLDKAMSGVEVAEMLGVTFGAVSQWKGRYQRAGPNASGNSSRLRMRLLPSRRTWLVP